jgi:hypothetical protein
MCRAQLIGGDITAGVSSRTGKTLKTLQWSVSLLSAPSLDTRTVTMHLAGGSVTLTEEIFFLGRVSACLPGFVQHDRLSARSGPLGPRPRPVRVPTPKLILNTGRTTGPSSESRPSC